jgi:hypothetical protein
VGKHEGKSLLARPRQVWGGDNLTMYLQEIGRGGGVDWIDLAQNSDMWWVDVDSVMNLLVP